MPRDVQIVRSAADDAPKDYRIPKDAEVVLRAVHATFTDNGAGTDWLPCVTLLSDSDHKIAQALDRSVKVTAGDDAEVSWFPGVKPTGVSTPASTSVAIAFADGGPQTTPQNTHTWASFGGVSVSDPSVFSWTSVNNPNDTLIVAPAGVLLCIGTALWNVNPATGNIYVDSAQAGIFRHTAWPTPQIGDGHQPPEGFSVLMDQCWINLTANNTAVHFAFSNAAAIASGPTEIQFAALMFVGAEA
jgi:hypothetical protein